MLFTTQFLSLLALASATAHAQRYPADSENLDPREDWNSFGNLSLFTRWRPTFHVLAPGGQMNDPCGPMYDAGRDEYHIFYQAHPQHIMSGDTAWSHAVSRDGMVTWQDYNGWHNRDMVAIPTSAYPANDWIGAFSGGAQAVGITGKQDGNLTLMYTGASRWPDSWKVPYAKYTEQQNIATSSDGGKTWQKWPGNPFLKEAPWNVTGWRDPIFALQPNFDQILGHTEPHYYLIFGSGIRGVGPRIPLYSAKASDLTRWDFLGALFEVGCNVSFGGDATVTGNFAYNFELASIFFLTEETANGGDGTTQHFILNMGSEGFADSVHKYNHWANYALGTVHKRQNQSIEMKIEAAGVADWGLLYAQNSFDDSKNKRQIIWGWAAEDINDYALKPLGYQGALGLPVEPYIKVTTGVLAHKNKPQYATDIWEQSGNGAWIVKTLARRPAPDVVRGLQAGAKVHTFGVVQVARQFKLPGLKADHFHLRATVRRLPQAGNLLGSFGVRFRASPDGQEYTQLNINPQNDNITVDRSASTLAPQPNKEANYGFFAPYLLAAGGNEPVSIDLFVDGSLVEVFVNDRVALTTRVYPTRADSLEVLLHSESAATFEGVTVWTDLRNVWPQRPTNSSSPLVFDPYEKTHITYQTDAGASGLELYAGI